MCTTLSQLFPGKLCMLFFKKGQAGVALISRYVSRYFFVLRMCLRTVNFSTHLNLTLNLPRFLLQLPTHTASSSQGWVCTPRAASFLSPHQMLPFPFIWVGYSHMRKHHTWVPGSQGWAVKVTGASVPSWNMFMAIQVLIVELASFFICLNIHYVPRRPTYEMWLLSLLCVSTTAKPQHRQHGLIWCWGCQLGMAVLSDVLLQSLGLQLDASGRQSSPQRNLRCFEFPGD